MTVTGRPRQRRPLLWVKGCALAHPSRASGRASFVQAHAGIEPLVLTLSEVRAGLIQAHAAIGPLVLTLSEVRAGLIQAHAAREPLVLSLSKYEETLGGPGFSRECGVDG